MRSTATILSVEEGKVELVFILKAGGKLTGGENSAIPAGTRDISSWYPANPVGA